jgi:L-arabinose isomerase
VERSGTWIRAACAWHDARYLKVARFGDNMRSVAVTEGDKVDAEIKLCYSVNGYGVGDLIQHVQQVTDGEIEKLTIEYDQTYTVVETAARRRKPASGPV